MCGEHALQGFRMDEFVWFKLILKSVTFIRGIQFFCLVGFAFMAYIGLI